MPTDGAPQNLDTNNLSLVISYKIHNNIVTYTHRSRQTRHTDKKTTTTTIGLPRVKQYLWAGKKAINKKFHNSVMPSPQKI